MSETIVFFGNERLATGVTTDLPVLKMLVANGYNIAAVITVVSPAKASRKPRPLEIVSYAKENNIPVVPAFKLKDQTSSLKELKASGAVLAAFGKIIPQEVIDVFPGGIINVHPSLLPQHRGPTPIESAILSGDVRSGVTIMQLVSAMDAGPVYGSAEIGLSANDSKQDLADKLGQTGANLLANLLPDILSGSLKPVAQSEANITYDKRIEMQDGEMDFSKGAVRLEGEIRAYLNWPRSRTMIGERQIVVTKAHVSDKEAPIGKLVNLDGELIVGTTDKSLVIDRLVPAGSREMSGKEFLAGYRL